MSREDIIAGGNRTPPLRAPYNFVRLNEKVLPTPLTDGPSHARPVADHLSGEIEVEWAAETPLLVGGSDNDLPCRFGPDENDPLIIPSASLRGLTRATLEIAAYARLAFVDDQLFGLRDFESMTWQGVIKNGHERYSVHNIEAGWLRKNGESVELSEVPYGQVAIEELCATLTAKGVTTTEDEWRTMSLHDRRYRITKAGLGGRMHWIKRTDIKTTQYEKSAYKLGNGTASLDGYLVVAGAANRPGETGSDKKYETVFFGGFEDGKKTTVPLAAVERFQKIQIEDGNQHNGPVEANWSYWKTKFENGESVPVFFCGRPNAPDFALALTRLMRVPFLNSVLDVAKRSQKPENLPDQLDFVQALFGCTPEKGNEPDPAKPLTLPWKGRVFFRHAELVGDAPEPTDAVAMVTMQPKPSFYPYYLRPDGSDDVKHPVDWSSDHARLAGRKRYPARNRATAPNKVVGAPNENKKAEQESQPQFLPATREEPLVCKSRIRLHNVSPIELGGLVFALTFGQLNQDQGYRHMLGRAKAYGYGQIKTRITGTRLAQADGKDAPSLSACLKKFKTWVTEQLGQAETLYEDLPEIAELLALAHAETGAALQNHLRFPSIDAPTDAEAILKAYQRIKKTTSTAEGSTFKQDGRDYRGIGNAAVSDQPNDEKGFWFLPRYGPSSTIDDDDRHR